MISGDPSTWYPLLSSTSEKMASNPHSKFTSFEIDVQGTKISGIHYLPSVPSNSMPDRPLIVLIHGGTCSAHNFDISPSLTASLAADFFSFPVVAINRPGYLNSTPLPHSEDSTYHKTLGNFNHEQLFPALWREYGQPQGCKALIPMAHSLGSPDVIVAAGLHAAEPKPKYPLAAFIFSGWGIAFAPEPFPQPDDPAMKLPCKNIIMLGQVEYNCAPPEAYDAIAAQDQPMKPEEPSEMYTGIWQGYWRTYSDAVKVPIMCGFGEHDMFWQGTQSHLKGMESCFPSCPRFDSSLLVGAPHSIEWSWMSKAWYARCFGFASEVTAAFVGKGKSAITA